MRKLGADAAFLVGVSFAIGLASVPAWTGTWIYDDWKMQASEKMDGWGDVLAAFGRTSADYLGTSASDQMGAVTYRPLSMLSLTAVQVLWPGSPLAHHLLSLALHLSAVWLLFGTVRALAGAAAARLSAVVFGLHPLGIEAYGWINGRSDVLAALGVLLVARALFAAQHDAATRTRGPPPWLEPVRALAGALIAGFAKETAQIALAGLLVAALLPARGTPSQGTPARQRAGRILACVSGILLVLGARAIAIGDLRRSMLSVALLPDLAGGLVRLMAVALEQILIPLPRTMENLGFRLAAPLAPRSFVLLVLSLAGFAFLLARRQLRAAVLVLTCAAMIAPCVVVRHTFWLGCDRYLYVPLALLCLALAPTFCSHADPRASTPLCERPSLLSPRAAGWLNATLAFGLACSSYFTAETYHNQTDHMMGMMRMRPDDPSGYLTGARWLWHRGQKGGAVQLLERVPRTGLPPALASQLATVLGEFGRRSDALAVVADMEARYPEDPFVTFDVMSVRLDEGRVVEAGEKAEVLRARGAFCRATRALFQAKLEQPDFAARHGDATRAQLARYACP